MEGKKTEKIDLEPLCMPAFHPSAVVEAWEEPQGAKPSHLISWRWAVGQNSAFILIFNDLVVCSSLQIESVSHPFKLTIVISWPGEGACLDILLQLYIKQVIIVIFLIKSQHLQKDVSV